MLNQWGKASARLVFATEDRILECWFRCCCWNALSRLFGFGFWLGRTSCDRGRLGREEGSRMVDFLGKVGMGGRKGSANSWPVMVEGSCVGNHVLLLVQDVGDRVVLGVRLTRGPEKL
jgi:hypothetical protein